MKDKPVLIVDDELSVRNFVQGVLEPKGFKVHSAGSGEECLQTLQDGFRGVILMDIRMPEMDGWDTIGAMVDRGLIEGNVVLMLTGELQPGDAMLKLRQYVVDYITKPFAPNDLVAAVELYAAAVP